jgi:hypothetical protein
MGGERGKETGKKTERDEGKGQREGESNDKWARTYHQPKRGGDVTPTNMESAANMYSCMKPVRTSNIFWLTHLMCCLVAALGVAGQYEL